MDRVRINAYAKLNLTLDVLGKTEGYHELDSLAVTVDLADRVTVSKRKDALVKVTMHGMDSEYIPPEHNHAVQAAEAFLSAFQTKGADITVYKNIPIGAGLGGSSADAAAVLSAMAKLYGITDKAALKTLADGCGSDVSFLMQGGLARMQGRGTRITPLPIQPSLFFLLLCPQEGISTAECFAEADKEAFPPPKTQRAAQLLLRGEWEEAASLFGNGLTGAAERLCPAVREALAAAKGTAPLGAAMTGSGSACFALFGTPELAAWAKSRYRGTCRAITVKAVYPRRERPHDPFVLGEDEIG